MYLKAEGRQAFLFSSSYHPVSYIFPFSQVYGKEDQFSGCNSLLHSSLIFWRKKEHCCHLKVNDNLFPPPILPNLAGNITAVDSRISVYSKPFQGNIEAVFCCGDGSTVQFILFSTSQRESGRPKVLFLKQYFFLTAKNFIKYFGYLDHVQTKLFLQKLKSQ